MVFAAGTTAYNIVELLHVLTVLVALAPVFVHPLLRKQMRAAGGAGHQQLVVAMAANARRLYGPALIVAGLLGIALIEMSEDAISLTEAWVIAAIVIWVAMIGILHGLIRPALKAQGSDGPSPGTDKRLEAGSALLSILFTVQLVLMIWQPGGLNDPARRADDLGSVLWLYDLEQARDSG